MAAIPLESGIGERLISGRRQRVAVGADRAVVELEVGDPWPADAPARLDLLLRTGHVLRFRADGSPDPLTVPHLRRVGITAPAYYQCRQWARRAAEMRDVLEVGGRIVPLLSGRPDGCHGFVIAAGRAFSALQGRADQPVDAGVLVEPGSRGDGQPGSRRRPRRRRRG